MQGQRIWTQRDQRLLGIAIGNEVVNRCRRDGRRWTELDRDELRELRYDVRQSFFYGSSAGETRAKRAQLFRYLDSGMVPILATHTVPHATPDLAAASPPTPSPSGGKDHRAMSDHHECRGVRYLAFMDFTSLERPVSFILHITPPNDEGGDGMISVWRHDQVLPVAIYVNAGDAVSTLLEIARLPRPAHLPEKGSQTP